MTAWSKGPTQSALDSAMLTHHVTVSIPHYGPSTYLRTAVESILSQTHRDLTCVVVFDGDRSGACAIEDIDDPRLIRHVLAENRGRYFADQVVLEVSRSDYFLVQDSDDWSESTRVERLLAEMLRTGADACISDVVHHDQRSGEAQVSRHSWPHLHDAIGPRLVHRAGYQGLYRTEILRSIGGWYGGYRIGFDTSVLNFIILAGGRVALVPQPLYHRNIWTGSLTSSPATGWNTPERRRVVNELSNLHRRIYIATRAGTARDTRSVIGRTVLAGRSGGAVAALRDEVDLLQRAIARIRGDGGRPEPAGLKPLEVRARLPDVHQLLARHGAANPNWSISVMAALELYRRLTTLGAQRILDVGSGLSTVVEAIAAARTGGRVLSLEHDPHHAARTRALLREAAVDHVAEVVVAPLVDISHPCGTGPWYGSQPSGTFDFILVDGPPLGAGGRIAVLPALAHHRRPTWELWLFDAHRPDEERCLLRWAEYFRFESSVEEIDPTGVAILTGSPQAESPPVLERLGVSLLTGGRPDLLERTLTTFAARWPDQVEAAHVVALVNGQDSASHDLLRQASWIDRTLTYEPDVLSIGMAASILTAAVTALPHIEQVLHLEDDWETRTLDIEALARASSLLHAPGVGQVRLRHSSEPCLGQHMITGRRVEWTQREDHRRGAAHFTFNPSLILRQVADLVFPAIDERDAQRRFLATGLDVVQLEPGVFAHIGAGRSRRHELNRRR
jgi:glycosyltransferase involved in cell wall biosynthesis